MGMRVINDAVLGRVDLNQFQADLDARNAALKPVVDDTPLERARHFERNGVQLRQILGRIQTERPHQFASLLDGARKRGDFIMPEGCRIAIEGARLCIQQGAPLHCDALR